MNIMDMSQSDFNNFLLEESQYRSPQEISDLRRKYREKNSLFSKIYDFARGVRQDIEDDGRRLHSFGLTSPEGGANNFSDVGFSLGGLLASALDPAARMVDASSAAATGNIPAEDMLGEAFGVAGGAMLGGSMIPVRGGPALRSNSTRVFHGGSYNRDDEINAPFFVTPDRKGAEYFAPDDEPFLGVADFEGDFSNALDIDTPEGIAKLSGILKKHGVDHDFNPDAKYFNETIEIHDIPKGSFYDGSNILDLTYIPAIREALKKEGVSALYSSADILENSSIPAYAVVDPSILGANRSTSGGVLANMFPNDVYHYMRTNQMEGDQIDTSRSFGRIDRLGPHVGTAKAAEDRFGVQFGQDADLIADYLERTGAETGMTLPLKARMDQPFTDADGKPFSEAGLLDVLNRYADQNQIADLDEAAVMFRKDLTDAGFTNIPYVNNLEDRGSVSHIMLTNRTAGDPEVLRSRFAAFEDAYDPSIMAANRSAVGGALAGLLNPDVQKATKEQLDPGGLSRVKLPDYASEIPFRTKDSGLLEPQTVLDISDLKGSTLVPAYGDRTYGGKMLTHIGDVELTQPVEMQGGHDFMRDLQTGLWASEKNALVPRSNSIDNILEEGGDPLMVYTAMAGQAGDFSHHMSDAVMGVIEQSKITKKAAKKFDDWVKGKGGAKETPADPNWPGILSPNARDYLNNNMTGTQRRLLWQEMDKKQYLEDGFPYIGAIRAAITDPELVNASPFDAGLSIGRASGGGLLDLDRPGLRHNLGGVKRHYSYDSQIEGDYLGRLIDSVPASILFRDFFDVRRDAGIKSSGDQRSFMMSPYVRQRVDDQMIDEVSRYLEKRGLL